jgi:hypothetical protein
VSWKSEAYPQPKLQVARVERSQPIPQSAGCVLDHRLLIEHGPEAEQVGAVVEVLAAGLPWRHVGNRSQDTPGAVSDSSVGGLAWPISLLVCQKPTPVPGP